ncbi:MAG: hypothetical protein GY710_01830 [Desulfobacteraceae bacterium]|nr:hypothetical protein [Desulfobacteraceae bacterium]
MMHRLFFHYSIDYDEPKGPVPIHITIRGELAFLEMENEPHYKIAKRLGLAQKTINDHLAKMAVLPNSLNTDLSQSFTVAQVAEKHGWTESMVWSLGLEDKDDREKFNLKKNKKLYLDKLSGQL